MKIKRHLFTFTLIALCIALLNGCTTPDDQQLSDDDLLNDLVQTAVSVAFTETPIIATETIASTATPTLMPTSTPTVTLELLPTNTDVPTMTPTLFPGFSDDFRFYSAWIDDDWKTVFYFMGASVDGPVYGKVVIEETEYPFTCMPDEQYPYNMICRSEDYVFGQLNMDFSFYTDPEHQHEFHSGNYKTRLVNRTVMDNCESEYRIYDGQCYEAHTCYDDFGNVVYYFDNIPYDGNFEGFSIPCDEIP